MPSPHGKSAKYPIVNQEPWKTPHHSRQAALQRAFEGRFVIGPMLDRGGVAEVFLVRPSADEAAGGSAAEVASVPQGADVTSRRAHHLEAAASGLMALKVLRPLLGLDDEIAAMFADEIRLMQLLDHDGVVRCIEGHPRHQPPYLLLEFVPGCNLARLFAHCCDRGRGMSWDVVWHIAVAMAEALAYLHGARHPEGTSLGLIHRDLSPPNVLLGLRGEVRLTDFGISIFHNMARSTSGEDPKGKFSYLAPEMLRGIAVDQRADIFSWGVIVWELLAGHRLFESSAPEETLKLVSDAPILAPHQLRSGAPAALEAIVMRALQRERGQRYRDVAQLVAELHEHRPQKSGQDDLARLVSQALDEGLLPPHIEPFLQPHVIESHPNS